MPDVIPNQPILHSIESAPATRSRRHLTYKRGETPFDAERALHYFYFILEGKIKISRVNPDTGKEQTLYLLERGDMFDVTVLLDAQPHDYLSEVLERTEVVEVPIASVRRLMHEDPSFQEFFSPYVAKQLRDMESLATDLSLYDVYRRLVNLFARSVDASVSPPELRRIGNLSHEELASMIGSVRKVVNRNLQTLKSEGVITLSRKQIRLKSLQRLLEKLG